MVSGRLNTISGLPLPICVVRVQGPFSSRGSTGFPRRGWEGKGEGTFIYHPGTGPGTFLTSAGGLAIRIFLVLFYGGWGPASERLEACSGHTAGNAMPGSARPCRCSYSPYYYHSREPMDYISTVSFRAEHSVKVSWTKTTASEGEDHHTMLPTEKGAAERCVLTSRSPGGSGPGVCLYTLRPLCFILVASVFQIK